MSRIATCLAILFIVFAVPALAAPPEKPKRTVSKVQTALFDAAKDGHAKDVERALTAGAKIDGPDETGVTAITYAIVQNSSYGREVIRDLLKLKASVNIKSDDGRTPLMYAAQFGKGEYFADLLGAGADVNAKDPNGWTPLMDAAFHGRSSDVSELLKAGADPKAQAADGITPTLAAVQQGNVTSIRLLLAVGGTLDGKQLKNLTPLILAATGDDLSALDLVLKSSSDLNYANKDGDTALMLAADLGNPDTVMALLRVGADTKPKDKDGKTAIDLAKDAKCDECAALIGAPWEKRKPSGGSTLSVPCDALGGAMGVNVTTEKGDTVWSFFYPKLVGTYLGGFTLGVKKISADVDVYLDIDNDPKTGLKPSSGASGDLGTGGAEYVIRLQEMGTSVQSARTNKSVNRQVLDPSISKGEERLGQDQMGDYSPSVERDLNEVRLRVPMSLLGLKPGAKIRVTARPAFCAPKSKVVTLG